MLSARIRNNPWRRVAEHSLLSPDCVISAESVFGAKLGTSRQEVNPMAVGRRPKRHNPNAERLTYTCELACCPHCGERLSSVGCSTHSNKTVQTLAGEFYVVAYSRVCQNPECDAYGTHFHAGRHLRVSPPYSTYGLDVIAFVGIQHERKHKHQHLCRSTPKQCRKLFAHH